jgi:hypothetical protein
MGRMHGNPARATERNPDFGPGGDTLVVEEMQAPARHFAKPRTFLGLWPATTEVDLIGCC